MSRRTAAGLLTVLAVLLPVTAMLLPAPPAAAVFPGLNGKIAFASARDGNNEIYTVNPDGSALTRLTDHSGDDSSPKWNLLGSKIAFTSNRDGDYDIYVMNADGSGQTNLTQSPDDDHDPSWSPDGQRIAFASNRVDATGHVFELYVLSLVDRSVVRLTTDGCTSAAPDHPCPSDGYSNINSKRPVWSPNGRQIAFKKYVGTSQSLYAIDADGSNQRLIAATGHIDAPDWSPDSRRLAFGDHSYGLLVVNADGSDRHSVPGTGGGCPPPQIGNCFLLGQPAWSPDGRALVAASLVSRTKSPGLYTLQPNGAGLSLVLDDAAIGQAPPNWQASRRPLSVSTSTTAPTSSTTTLLPTTTTSLVAPTTSTTLAPVGSEACRALSRIWSDLDNPSGIRLREALSAALNCRLT